MRKSKVLAKLRAGKVARICATGSPIAFFPAVAARFGYDGIWNDGEHRVWNPRDIETAIGRHHAADIDCVWRSVTKEKNGLYRLLEDGASGLMIPHVATADEARALVSAIKFPPLGDRGFCGGGRDADYWIGKPADYTDQANHETFLTVQIETPQALENAEAIAAVPGVDILFIGPGDMSLRLGCTPGVHDPVMLDVQKKVAAAAKKHGKAWGRPVGSAADAKTIIDLGAQFVVLGSEFGGIHDHLAACAAEFDQLLGEGQSTVADRDGKAY
ncbi:MAG: aldolase [Verrucomicrobiaceae bacterium]|jgi:4-hydroxy-2-oxoheptanedioate aldolase|nr:aldolase [Verrucomicrobiaceae bacterium]